MNFSIHKLLIFYFFISLPVLVVRAQNGDDLRNEQLNIIRNLQREVNSKKIDTLLVKQYSELSRLYSTIDLYDEALEFVNKSLNLSQKLKYVKGEASAYASLGSIYFDRGQYDKAIHFLTLALEKCKANKQEVDMTFIYRFLGESHLKKKDTARAIHYHEAGLSLSKKLNIPNRVAFADDFLGHIYFHQNKYEKAIEHFKNALTISEKLGNNNRVALAAGNIGMSYVSLNEKREGIKFLTHALKYYKIDENINGYIWMHSLISDIYKQIGEYAKALEYNNMNLVIHTKNKNALELANTYQQKGEILMAKGDFSEAEKLFSKALEVFKRKKSASGQAKALTSFGELYYLKKDFQKALQYLNEGAAIASSLTNQNLVTPINVFSGAILIIKGEVLEGKRMLDNALAFYKNIKTTKYLPFIYQNLAISDSILGNYAASLNNYKLFIKHHNIENKDNFYTEKTAYQFEFEKKEAIAEAELKTRKTQRNAALGGLVLTSFIIVFFIYFLRLRNKKLKVETENLELQKRELIRIKEIEHFKSRFLTNITHDFRTPLTLIKGYIEVIKESNQEVSHLKEMEYSSNQMLQLINQLIGLSKMESGNYQLKYRKGDLLETIAASVQAFDSLAKQKKILLAYSIDQSIVSSFDPKQFVYSLEVVMTVLSNLLSNAFKFTSEGGEVKVLINTLDSKTLVIKVSDTGIGIPSEEIKNVFDRYHQIDTPTQRTYEGSGIGLAVVKEMVLLHGGNTFVESESNKGTTFTIHLKSSNEIVDDLEMNEIERYKSVTNIPFINDNDTQDLDEDAPVVLVVEDKTELRKFIVNNLGEGYQFIEAANGKEGIELAQKFLPDLIISDIMMPDTDGLELCKQLKNNVITSNIPIILLTAKSDETDILFGLEQGADDYLIKPFSLVEIRLRVRNILRTRALFRNKFNKSNVLTSDEKNTEFNLKEKEFIEKLEDIVMKNTSNQLFGVTELSEEMFLSTSQLSRKLKSLINKTPGTYIQNMRLDQARQFLLDGYDVSETAWKVGYEDPVYFSKIFKKHFGIAPSFIKN